MISRTAATPLEGALPPAEVMDLVRVRPLGEDEPAIRAALQNRLRAIHANFRS